MNVMYEREFAIWRVCSEREDRGADTPPRAPPQLYMYTARTFDSLLRAASF